MEVGRERREKTQTLWTQGDQAQMQSDLGNAMRLYQESISRRPVRASRHTIEQRSNEEQSVDCPRLRMSSAASVLIFSCVHCGA